MKKNNNLLNLKKLQYKLISPHILQPSLKSSVCSSAFLFDSKLDKISKISNSSASSDPYAVSQVYCIPPTTQYYLSIPIPQPTAYEMVNNTQSNPNILSERSDEQRGVIVIQL
jgi:hypothetical protein|tara:strand:+ start:333 stop:671 length:339 start_codon:yes stop_codon:yes gene_type:complete